MTILIVERVSAGLRGELSRWMLEVKAGVYVGRVAAPVREALWQRAVQGRRNGAVVMIFRAETSQGYDIWVYGERSRLPASFDGLTLIRQVQ